MKKIIALTIISLIFSACNFKADVVMPEQPKAEKEIIALRHKIELAEKEIAILETINESIDKNNGSKTLSKIYSKNTTEFFKGMDERDLVGDWVLEITRNSERIYELLSRIQMWNDAIYKFY